MTIVATVRVNDGIVLAADSATSFFDEHGNVVKVYNNANKLFNLVKVWPIGAMTYGAGGIGAESLSTLSKDFRKKLDPKTSDDDSYKLDPKNYTVEEVAIKAKRFLFDQKFQAQYPAGVPKFFLGYRVCGYSSGQPLPEAWEIRIIGNACEGPERLYQDDHFGPRWAGESEALDRLILGVGSKTQEALVQMGTEPAVAEQTTIGLAQHLNTMLYLPAMPIQDAIDLAYFLADTASKFAQFSLRAATVGGPVEVATITKHEGFKWVTRKHYYTLDYNREQ